MKTRDLELLNSIQDQVDLCKRFLEDLGISNVTIDVLFDAEISGERISRPGIDQVRSGIVQRKWDLLLTEDCGRLFRDEVACGQLINVAIDNKVRVIAINDHVDTADEDFEDRLPEAMRHHARANRYTSKRIKRSFEALWDQNAAIGLLKTGYRREASIPATKREPEGGPFFDHIDETWAPIIREAFERVARKDLLWSVANWLTEMALPKASNSTSPEWTDRNVLDFIRRTVYRGVETYRATIVNKVRTTGVHLQVKNAKEEVWTREMPHLRIVEDWVWYAANDAIDERRNRDLGSKEIVHPLAGIPRDSRGPLSGLFFCGICGGKMYAEGRAEGGYRCNNAAQGKCWNKATAEAKVTHEKISEAITKHLLSSEATLQVIVERLRVVLSDDDAHEKEIEEANKKIRDLTRIEEKLLKALECSEEPPVSLVEQLAIRGQELSRAKADLSRLTQLKITPASLPSEAEMRDRLKAIGSQLLEMNRETNVVLRQLTPQIDAVPYQQFDSAKVVLRARFELSLASFLPLQLLPFFEGKTEQVGDVNTQKVVVLADLFNRSAGPKHGAEAFSLKKVGLTLVQIGKRLGISKRNSHIAEQFGKKMHEASIADPFIELKQAPEKASRWRNEKSA